MPPVVERALVPNTPQSGASPIAGSVLPIKRAEELLATLPGVIAARIVASDLGAVDEIHILTTAEVTPKQTVRNVESALIAHLGMKVDHRKISVATTIEPKKVIPPEPEPYVSPPPVSGQHQPRPSQHQPASSPVRERVADRPAPSPPVVREPATESASDGPSRRVVYFEHVEVRRSRTKGVTCRVTLRKGSESYIGEAEGADTERSRCELAARAALTAILQAEGGSRTLALDGCKMVDAFERAFVFAGISASMGREPALLTGSCEVKDSPETAAVLAVLDATNRWMELK